MVDPKKVQVDQSTPQENNQTDLRRFLGIAGYYRHFIQIFDTISVVLHAGKFKNLNFSCEQIRWRALFMA